jgi:hypothetical protein
MFELQLVKGPVPELAEGPLAARPDSGGGLAPRQKPVPETDGAEVFHRAELTPAEGGPVVGISQRDADRFAAPFRWQGHVPNGQVQKLSRAEERVEANSDEPGRSPEGLAQGGRAEAFERQLEARGLCNFQRDGYAALHRYL